MQLNLERPDYQYTLRGANGSSALVNAQRLQASFIISPNQLIENWPVQDATALTSTHFDELLALNPELILLGTGARQVFPPAAVLAACLQHGIGVEVMANDSAARTYTILAGEGRRVVAAFLFAG
ncbi:MAG: Mth938-like domain-containing protein [Thermomonas sp.]|uniref:Mth938-like domain-containing protein n=1 Tax=Thermomonas sp. TaxID=1971895 RepID=UPI001EBC1F2C|nr:Mth938-like domain-containing protein [Thermomonas sp.]MBV2210127.1 Mth938-like domain-containing protein [Thermomonas sp.]